MSALDSSSSLRLAPALSPGTGAGNELVPPSPAELEEELLAAASGLRAPAQAASTFALSPAIRAALGAFAPLRLEELNAYALLNRTDTKFVLTERQIVEVFAAIRPGYRVLEIAGVRASHYFTQYFDTPAMQMYRDHHNGVRDRFKVRRRLYVDSGACFLEIKRKNSRERTIKIRMPVPVGSGLTAAADFVRAHTPYDPADLSETCNNECLRATLAGVDAMERLTIDFGFSFQWRGLRGVLPGLVIAEVKQPRFSTQSAFVRELRARHIEPTAFSKFCVAIAVLDPDARYNRFKPLLFHLQRLLAPYTDRPGAEIVSGRMPAPAEPSPLPVEATCPF